MFSRLKFQFCMGMMRAFMGAGLKAFERGDVTRAITGLRQCIITGRKTLGIAEKNPKIDAGSVKMVEDCLKSSENLYRSLLFQAMPEGDREIVSSTLSSWLQVGITQSGMPITDQVIGMYEIAKRRLDQKEVLRMIYSGSRVPPPLEKIMMSYVDGETTREETEKRLDDCVAKLRLWIPEMLLDDLALAA